MSKSTGVVILITVLGVIAGMLLGYGFGIRDTPKDADYKATLPACSTEDSTNCVWDARIHGNGEGRSFVDLNGHTYYLEGK